MSSTTDTGSSPAIAPARPSLSGQAPTAGPVVRAQHLALSAHRSGARAPDDGATPPGRAWSPHVVLARLRGHHGLTGVGVAVLAVLVLAPGVAVDLVVGGSFGLASAVFFVLASLAGALAARPAALASAAVLPPLLFTGAVTTLAWRSGDNAGTRELGLDVGTTLALSAPLLFVTTAATVAVVLARAAVRLARR